MNTSVAIIGGGISGISLARMLVEQGIPCTVFEKEQSIGGLVKCSYENDNLFHRVGGHVFNSKNESVLEWFWQFFNKSDEFAQASRSASIFLSGKFIDYPIELNLSQLDEITASSAIAELFALGCQVTDIEGKIFDSFQDFLLNNFGPTLYALYFEPYNSKIWKTPLSDIPLEWLKGKLPMVSPKNIIKSNILGKSDSMVHSRFFYPIKGGSQFIVNRISEGVDVRHENVKSISIENGKYFLNYNKNIIFSDIVYTGDLRNLGSLLVNVDKLSLDLDAALRACESLKSNSTSTMLCECDKNDYSWIYLPESVFKAHRIIMTGNFSQLNNSSALPPRRITCTVEVSGHMTESSMISEIDKMPFNMTPIAYNYCPSSYVVHDASTHLKVKLLKQILESARFYCHGRFAEWQYYNMDAAIESSLSILQSIRLRAS
jgi:protoporphyrinogen oxidase